MTMPPAASTASRTASVTSSGEPRRRARPARIAARTPGAIRDGAAGARGRRLTSDEVPQGEDHLARHDARGPHHEKRPGQRRPLAKVVHVLLLILVREHA